MKYTIRNLNKEVNVSKNILSAAAYYMFLKAKGVIDYPEASFVVMQIKTKKGARFVAKIIDETRASAIINLTRIIKPSVKLRLKSAPYKSREKAMKKKIKMSKKVALYLAFVYKITGQYIKVRGLASLRDERVIDNAFLADIV